jgi:hypothetical protein
MRGLAKVGDMGKDMSTTLCRWDFPMSLPGSCEKPPTKPFPTKRLVVSFKEFVISAFDSFILKTNR